MSHGVVVNETQTLEDRAALPALRLVQAPTAIRMLARVLIVLVLLLPVALAVVPWQQNVTGSGAVVAFNPLDRTQVIQAPIPGRVVRSWVLEGTAVKKGDPLIEMEDNDPGLVDRLAQMQRSAQAKLDAAKDKERAYQDALEATESAREQAVQSAESKVQVAIEKVRAEQQALEGAVAAYEQKLLDYERQRDLARQGVVSELKAQEAERDYKAAKAKVEESRAKVAAARNEERMAAADLGKTAKEWMAKIEESKAKRDSAKGDVAVADQDLVAKVRDVERQKTQRVVAPRDGRVFRLRANTGAEQLKAGDPLLELVPETEKMAVELWIDGNDLPLVREGRAVRLQFEGWPAVQFAGWPSVAVGTFGGRVALVDQQDDGRGRFRILVLPDESDEAWPDQRFLRQGVRTNGWILLDSVRAGYEIWRQLNGFPPTVAMPKDGAPSGKGKGAK